MIIRNYWQREFLHNVGPLIFVTTSTVFTVFPFAGMLLNVVPRINVYDYSQNRQPVIIIVRLIYEVRFALVGD